MMKIKCRFAAALAMISLASPLAAADPGAGERTASQLGLFAGGTVRLSLDGRRERPTARLSFGSYRLADRSTGSGFHFVQPRGLEFGASESGRAGLFVAGQPMADVERRLRLNGSSSTLLLVGGAVALGVVALLVLDDDNDDCCLDPNVCEPCDD